MKKKISILESRNFHFALKTTISFALIALPYYLIEELHNFRFYWALFTVCLGILCGVWLFAVKIDQEFLFDESHR
jgi:peptidoglycan/LPS O-acetylase OafA/YrhL